MACYLEPRLLRIPPLHSLHATLRDAFRDRTYYEPSKAPGGLFQHGADEDILSYFKQWDAHRRLLLLTPSETSRAAWGELFEAPKSQEATRVVFNRISQNFTEVHLATASSTIPPGFALCDLHLDSPTSVARIHTDDVVDFYPAFLGSDERGRTNVVFGVIVMVIALYFFLADGPAMVRTVMHLSPLDDDHERILISDFDRISRAVVLATLLSAVGQGVLAGLGFWVISRFVDGFQVVFTLTLLTTILALVPFVGAAAVWAPVSLWLFYQQE